MSAALRSVASVRAVIEINILAMTSFNKVESGPDKRMMVLHTDTGLEATLTTSNVKEFLMCEVRLSMDMVNFYQHCNAQTPSGASVVSALRKPTDIHW